MVGENIICKMMQLPIPEKVMDENEGEVSNQVAFASKLLQL